MARGGLDALMSLRKYAAEALGPEWEVRLADEGGEFRRPYCRVTALPGSSDTGGRWAVERLASFNLLCHPAEATTAKEAAIGAERVRDTLLDAFSRGLAWLPSPAAPVAAGAAGALAAGTYHYRIVAENRRGQTTAGDATPITLASPGGVALTWPEIPGALAYLVFRGPSAGATKALARVTEGSFTDDGSLTASPTGPPAQNRAKVGMPRRVPLWNWDGVALNATSTERQEPDYMRVRDCTVEVVLDAADPLLRAVSCNVRLAWKRPADTLAGETLQSVTVRHDQP